MFAPENTVAAFRAAEGKADMVETDARVSSDGILVIMHDAMVDRTTGTTNKFSVSSLTLAQLKSFDAGSWFSSAFAGERIPTLEEMVTNTLPFATPLIEHKAGTPAQYVAELRRLNAITNVVVQSFDWTFLAGVHSLEPSIRLCALGSGALTTSSLTTITNAGCGTVAWAYGNIGATEVALVHSWGLKLFVWTVDNPAQMQSFIDMGVDGIISNDPASVNGQQVVVTNAPTHLSDRLVTYWKFDDGLADAFATTVTDSRGANAGTLVRNDGASHWLEGGLAKLGGSLKLEGANAFVTVPQTGSLDINTNALSISAWVWLPVLPSQLATSYGAIYDSTTDCYVLYMDRGNKELRFKVSDINGHAARPGIPETLLVTNQWLHIVATYAGSDTATAGRACIFMNGQLCDVHTGSDSTTPVGLTANVKTGQAAAMGREGPTGGNAFNGRVDDFAIWKRPLSVEEVTSLYEAGQVGVSLDDLLHQPTPLIEISSVEWMPSSSSFRIDFLNHAHWQSFKLFRADTCTGPFLEVEGLSAGELGNNGYRFVCPMTGKSSGFFRIAGE